VYLTGSTNSSGDVAFTPSPATAGTLYVTVTKHNFLPHDGSAQATSGGPPPPITDLEIALSQQDLVLAWNPPEEKTVVRYVVYRSTTSDFVPVLEDSIGGTANTTYTDLGATGLVGTNYFYAVKAVSDSQQKSEPSNTVGEFDVNLISEPPK
jgi:hypothetical protein